MTADAVGGVWTYATALSRELCRQGFEIALVTLGPEPRDDQLRHLQGIEGLDFEATDLALEWMDPEGRDLERGFGRLTAIESRVHPDIVHLNGFREAAANWKAPRIVVAHSCVRSWWRACRGKDPTEPQWLDYIANVGAGLKAANEWVAPTAAFRDLIAQLYAPPAAGRVIWNGIEARIRSTAKQPFVLAAGRLWDEAKNLAILSRVAGRLQWPIRVAGPLHPPCGCKDSRSSRLEYLGELSRNALDEVMQRAAILVAPALYEPFGLTVLEAARAGCALVISDLPSFRELWDGAALFIDPLDDRQLQDALASLIGDSPKLREFQRRASERSQRYSLAAMAQSYADLYNSVAHASAPVRMPASADLAVGAS
ncbi:MAG TPA: glycosyltransferase family 4 protein [Xanthobacteraceae bacterium]|jgi:glycosyltransferase involved in cell wall biosynthesis